MRTVAIIQARMGSSRFPGKVLTPLAGKPVLWHIVHRLRKCHTVDTIAVATSTNAKDDPIEEFAVMENIEVIRGSEDNVLSRYALAAKQLGADIIVRICGDSPLIDPVTIDLLVKTLINSKADYCKGDPQIPTIHEGFSPFTFSALQKLVDEAGDDPVAKEHVTAYFKKHPRFVRAVNVKNDPGCRFSGARISVDTPADLRFLEEVYKRLNMPAGEADVRDVVSLLHSEPDLLKINAHVRQKTAEDQTKRILIRCDGDSQIGLGHVYRCLALADELREVHACGVTFAMSTGSVGFRLVCQAGYAIEQKPSDMDEYLWLCDVIYRLRADVLALDIRSELSRGSVEKWRKEGLLIIIIDDPSERRLAADLAFYPPARQVNPVAWTGFTGELYVGWEWVILRKEFSHGTGRDRKLKSQNSRPRILVTMGGSDPNGLTLRVIGALDTMDEDFEVKVIAGKAFSHTKALENLLLKTHRHFDIHRNVENMPDLMGKSNLAITSFGVTAYELATMGVPAIHLCLTQDHVDSASTFVDSGTAICLGMFNQVTPLMLTQKIHSLISDKPGLLNMGNRARQKVDGRGVERIGNIVARSIATSHHFLEKRVEEIQPSL